MIELRNLSKVYRLNGVSKVIANNISFTFPTGESVALIGRNGAGKSTMLQMIAGTIQPSSGEIIRHGSVSFPVGFSGSFHPDLTGAQNVKFVARIYGVDTDETVEFTRDFAQLGEHFYLPVRSYSSGMKSRLAFGMSMAMRFDTYLIDEVTAVGDVGFRARSEAMLLERLKNSGAVFVSHSPDQMKHICQSGVVLQNGNFYYYAEIEKALEHYTYTVRNMFPPWLRRKRPPAAG
ncbi:ABC transporter ATP-binding protein [Thalassovita taeanensis]|uniref:Capsular polysaccharide transport system ATP-binding protein n=1 Tax=Thalassovita taeanensis TaxID=657014 RepID=A0A1H9L299_9RHOB|nr:ABC transporter ATP-binding protein [Thalassovita taeanensis]SER05275.1 capsular polysaccharide transport system ATP-binding protein [Thalassovita taeanensis]